MPQAIPLIMVAATVIGTAVSLYGTDTAARQEEANRNFAADQAAADAAAEKGAAMVEAERIRRAGKKQKSAAIAAAAASGVDVNSTTALRIDQDIGQNSEEDAYLTIVNGVDRAARLNQQGTADRIAGRSARTAGRVQMASTLISSVGQVTNYGSGWKKG